MIRILNILQAIGSGGVERRRLSMAKLLNKQEFELKIICTRKIGVFADEFKKYNVEVIEIGDLHSVFDYKQHLKVMAVVNEFKPHIIHGAVFEGVTMAAISGFLKRVPIVILEETSDPQNRRWTGNLLMKLLCLLADQVVGVSPAATDYLENTIHVSKQKVKLITNGVAIPNTVPDIEKLTLKQQFSIAENEIIIGSVGRMSSDEHKRFSDLIKAVAVLVNRNLPIKLILVGDGAERNNYEKLAENLGIKNNVIFAGYQNEVGKFYSVFDIFCLTSAFEAFGLVVAEAMLHYLPVVATSVGGIQYIVDDGKSGFLVEKFNIDEIANALAILCSDKEKRTFFGKNGYLKAIENYTEEKYVEKVKNLYLEQIKNKQLS